MSIKIHITIFILTLVFFLPILSLAQSTNKLDQNITIEAENVTISELLLEIGQQAGIKFSYNPKLIESDKRVDVSITRKSVRFVLDDLFSDQFEYKLRENYVIIAKKNDVPKTGSVAKKNTISGYVIDEETQGGISNVSIYTSSGDNEITNDFGAFNLNLNKKDNAVVEFRKKGFEPLSFNTNHTSVDELEITMRAIKRMSIIVNRDTSATQKLVSSQSQTEVTTMYKINTSLQINQENIIDTIHKPVSFSLYPGVATYGNLSGNIIFNYAMNFVGYNRGINGVELGALSNINRENVKGVQLAGLSNYVGNDVIGYQAGGIFNKVGGRMQGLQMAGVSNVNFGDVVGVQLGGVNNHVSGHVTGLQMAGVYNQSDDLSGAQLSGVVNLADTISGLQMAGVGSYARSLDGLQLGGVFNYAKYVNGAQISGVGNHTQSLDGFQLSGVYNYAKYVDGMQISGVLNVAKVVNGSQLGLINVVDSISGIPIGLLSFVKSGYKRVGVFADELFPLNLEFRTGVNKFHSILRAGVQTDLLDKDESLFTFGYGFGSSIPLNKYFSIELDVTGNHISKREFTNDLSLNLKGYLGLEVSIYKNLSIAGGAAFNAFYFDRELLDDEIFNNLRGKYINDTSTENSNSQVWRSWLGYRIGLRYSI
jgi:hypothetical protein